jgi:NAD(P)-dependent dehydrogenase (short-subunit alcohol dehydrogenase family)
VQNLKGKVALVTGAGSGIGEAAALLLAKRGASVGILGRHEEELADLAKRIGSSATVLTADISKQDQVVSAIENLVAERGSLDIVFANAGINGVWAPIEGLKLEEWQETIDINLTGTFLTIKHAVPHLKEKGGSVIITSSVNGTRMFSNTGATAYACTKGAQAILAKMLALELAQWKVRVNVICPGAIETEIGDNTEIRNTDEVKEPVEYPEGQVPLTDGGPGRAEQVAKLVAFLASEESDHISGTEIWIDGAQSLLVG